MYGRGYTDILQEGKALRGSFGNEEVKGYQWAAQFQE